MAGIPFLWKGAGEHTGKGLVMLPGDFSGQVFIAGPDGKPIQNLTRDTTKHVPEPGDKPGGDFGQKYLAPAFGGQYGQNFLIGISQGGKTQYVRINNGAGEYRGTIDPGEGTLDKPAQISPYGPGANFGGISGVPGQFTPGQIGQFGVAPAYIGGMFPTAAQATYNPIQAAKYNFTDPLKFAQSFGQFNRGEIQKNFDLSKDLALKELSTELSSLQNFVPAAAALKRSETSIDNQFNQAQRTAQINQVLPNARGDLAQQESDARAYASGRIPDSVTNQAYELGIRSQAADRAAAGGFGATSSVARKASDLLSAQQRIGLSQYGNQLLQSNIGTQAGLFLSPTEYSNAGQQVNVNPSVSASQLIDRNIAQINGLASIPATQGLQSQTQQNQFQTNLQQQTNQFNASNQLGLSEFNANNLNNFALTQFGYNAQYANSVASGANANINTNLQLQQQQLFNQLQQDYMQQAQNAQLLTAATQGIGALLGANGGVNGLLNTVGNLFSGFGGFGGTAGTGAAEAAIGAGGLGAAGITGLQLNNLVAGQAGNAVQNATGSGFLGDIGTALVSAVGK